MGKVKKEIPCIKTRLKMREKEKERERERGRDRQIEREIEAHMRNIRGMRLMPHQ